MNSDAFLISEKDVEDKIANYEKLFGISSDEFLRQMRDGTIEDSFETMDWMTRDELSQAIPPAYTEWIGKQVLHTAKAKIRNAWEDRKTTLNKCEKSKLFLAQDHA